MSLSQFYDELQNVTKQLIKEPQNEELLALKDDLEEMIKLEGGTISIGNNNEADLLKWDPFKVGYTVAAKDSDGSFYRAKITSKTKDIVTIQFEGTSELINIQSNDIQKVTKDTKRKGQHSTEYLQKRREKKKLKMEEKIKQESQEYERSQSKWQKFKKGPKKFSNATEKIAGAGSVSRLYKK